MLRRIYVNLIKKNVLVEIVIVTEANKPRQERVIHVRTGRFRLHTTMIYLQNFHIQLE